MCCRTWLRGWACGSARSLPHSSRRAVPMAISMRMAASGRRFGPRSIHSLRHEHPRPPALKMLDRIWLLQMASQAFPIGGYSHSYGLEAAVDSGAVRDEETVGRWIADVLEFS